MTFIPHNSEVRCFAPCKQDRRDAGLCWCYNRLETQLMKTNDQINNQAKVIHVKPSLYAFHYYELKEIARNAGWNLVLHGSMNRDLDLILIPWAKEITKDHLQLIEEFMEVLGGHLNDAGSTLNHGRLNYVINLNRGGYANDKDGKRIFVNDPQYYIDISVIPLNYQNK